MQEPREQRIRHLADPAVRKLGAEHPQLEPLNDLVVLVAEIDVQYADLRVQRTEQQHRVPIAQEPTQGTGLAGERRDEHERHEQSVRCEQQVPAGVVLTRERQDGGGCDGDVEQGDDVDGGEPL